ncbi:MAG: HDOD domain-containing protein [Acidobacteriota bacterium]
MPPDAGPGPESTSGPVEPGDIAAEIETRLADGAIDLPVLPRVATEVVDLTSRPDSATSDLVDLIHRDQALAANVLRVANSVLYGGRIPIVSLRQAIARLGMEVLSQIALTASMQTDLYRVPGYEEEIHRLWRHALVTGQLAREIARDRRQNVESAFLCGLLHAVGKPVVLKILSDLTPAGTLDLEMVHRLTDEFQVEAGTMLAAEWNLPDDVTEAMVVCANPARVTDCSAGPIIATVAAALGRHLLGEDPDMDLTNHPGVAQLNIDPDALDSLIARSEEILERVDTLAG